MQTSSCQLCSVRTLLAPCHEKYRSKLNSQWLAKQREAVFRMTNKSWTGNHESRLRRSERCRKKFRIRAWSYLICWGDSWHLLCGLTVRLSGCEQPLQCTNIFRQSAPSELLYGYPPPQPPPPESPLPPSLPPESLEF